MNWRDLTEQEPTSLVAPWTGGDAVDATGRSFRLRRTPREYGWYAFTTRGRFVLGFVPCDPHPDELTRNRGVGYLAGDRFYPDDAQRLSGERVFLIPSDGERDHFDRAVVGRHCEDGPLVYAEPAPPLGPESAARRCLDDGGDLLAEECVMPGLYGAFLVERDQRAVADAARRAVEARLAREQREAEARRLVGSAVGRRELAALDLPAACAAALRLADAEFIELRGSGSERVVRFRLPELGRRFECVVDARTLRVVEAGVCLTDDDTGERGDDLFTLEALPGVIREAERLGVLVVFRHV